MYKRQELVTVCGLGTGPGLLGWNCYHEYYPFIKGISERNWTDEWLAAVSYTHLALLELRAGQSDVCQSGARPGKLFTSF